MGTKMIFLTLLLVTGLSTIAQTVFRGVVVDAESKQPISNAKIGITSQGVGVVSNASGEYIYKKYQETLSDTDRLIISAPGYDTIELEAKKVRTLLNRNSTTRLEKSLKTNAVGKIENVKIFWDLSEGMQDRDLEQELETIKRYLDRLGAIDVTLQVFNNKIIATEKWKKWDGDMSRFRESVTQTTYDGPSNYSILDFEEADAVILASNGEPNYGKLAVSQGQPVYSISSIKTAEGLNYLERLSLYTSGSVLRVKGYSDQQLGHTTSEIAAPTKNTIEGKITSLGQPVSGATLMILGDLAEYSTNQEGIFTIPASEGDILFVRALGLFPKKVMVSTNDLNIDLIPSSDQLDEVLITEKREKIIVGNKEMRGLKVPNVPGGVTPSGDFYITADDIEPDAKTLDQILREKFAGITLSQDPYNGPTILINGRSPQWILNGVLLRSQPPPLYLSNYEIESIVVKEPGYETSRYGELLSGDAIIVTTKSAPLARAKRVSSALAKNNDYKETKPSIDTSQNIITGTVIGPKGPIQGAEVLRKGSFEMASTASDGSFKLKAKKGDVLLITALGTFSKTVAVTDQKEYTINVLANKDYLDEVVITGETRKLPKTQAQEIFEYGPDLETGRYKLKGFGSFNVTTITKDDFKFEIAPDMEKALSGRFESLFISPEGRPFILRGAFREFIELFIDGQRELGPIFQVNPLEVVSISIKSDKTGVFPPALLIDTNRSTIVRNPESLLAKNNDYEEEIADISNATSTITGTVLGPQGPIQYAEVLRKGSFEIANTDSRGNFKLNIKDGDVLIVSALGMFTKEIRSDSKDFYTINLLPEGDILNEVEITGDGTKDRSIDTYYGKKNPDAVGYDVKTLTSDDIKDNHYSIVDVLNGRFANVTATQSASGFNVFGGRAIGTEEVPMLIDIDGQIFGPNDAEPPGVPPRGAPIIDPSRIESISIIKGLSGVTRYGRGAEGGVVIIKTKGISGNASAIASKPSALVTDNNYNEELKEIATVSKITGIITGPQGPINEASITKKGTFNEVSSTITGGFSINASLGDILVISASGMFPKEILIENQDIGTIELTPKTSDLDAIVLEGQKRVDNTVQTADGKINADKLGYAVETLEGNDFSSGYTDLRQLITGKVAGVEVGGGLYSGSGAVYKIRGGTQSITNDKPPIWIVNGTPYQDVPNFLDVQQIKSISVLKSVIATSRYGSLAAGGAFLIKTNEVDFKNKAAASNQSALVSGNEYAGDVTGDIDAALPSYIIRFRESGTPQQQLALYKKLSRTQKSPLEYYVDAAQYFESLDPKLGDEVRSDLAYIARNNTKALRTLAYLYELVNDYKNVVLVNERIVKIAPQESQSYRDLALAYQNNKQYDKALELYINMLGEQIMGVNFDGLENPLRSELSRLIALYKDKIDFSRLPNEWLRADFKIDMRMVIDWSDRSVPFEFQFVNPDKKFFKWTHTLEENRERLEMEQKQGFQTEEFIIDDAPPGEWIINIQYLGDEGDYALPPFLKYTVYRNYGTPQETKEIRVIKLFKQIDKVTLGRVTM